MLWFHKKKLVLVEEKFVKWQHSRNECCDFTEKIMSKFAMLKLADYKWHLTKVNKNPENWQCVMSEQMSKYNYVLCNYMDAASGQK